MKKLLIVFALLLIAPLGGAQVINAASCSSTDVQTAFSAVVNSTTTVNIPSCSATPWSTQVTLTVPSGNTNLTIQGGTTVTGSGDPALNNLSATDHTTITANLGSSILNITTAGATSHLRITGLTFQGGASFGGVTPMIGIDGLSQNVRIDHNHINLSTYNASGNIGIRTTDVAGVFDHNLCDDNQGVSECINVEMPGYGGHSFGDGSWNDTTQFGTSNAFYIEQNTFNQGIYNDDCSDGGRKVYRFNTSNAGKVQTHPTGSGPRFRGCRTTEVYRNQFNGDPTCDGGAGFNNCGGFLFWLSAGASVVWGNNAPLIPTKTFSGYSFVYTLQSMRRNNNTYTQTATPNGWGYCGTSFNGTGSLWDQSSSSSSGYRCMDQPGQGVGDLLSGNFPSVTNSTLGSPQWPREALEPVYEWLDTFTPVPSNPSGQVQNSDATAFVNNTDYYQWCNASSNSGCSSFTGATGTGSGTLASRPATCTTGVAYFATDQGSWNTSGNGAGNGVLYKCTSTNTWTTFYTPFGYPHALESAPTLASITLLPPANGYNLTSNVATAQLTPQCSYVGGVPAPDNCTSSGITLTWGSTDTSQITVNSSGLVTGAGGTTCVTPEAYAYSGQIIGHARVLIDCSTITSLTSRPGPVSGVTSSHVVVGTTILLGATDNNNNDVGSYVAWTTSDPTKATVNNIGEVTGVAAGSATITATIAGHSVGRTINVTSPSVATTTYYVRPGGGNRTQSTGLCDVDYPGSGTGTCSAFSEIEYCWTDESSSSVYTGAVAPGGTCHVHPGKTYTVGNKNFSTAWITYNGGLGMPSGTPANPTKLIADCSPSCSTDPDNPGNRVLINTFGSGNSNVLFETQNVVMEGFDITSGEDCNHTVSNGVMNFACPTGHVTFWVLSDMFTANVTFNNMRIHGFFANWTGTPGPGVVFNNVASEFAWLTGINFDNPFGEPGNRTDGFVAGATGVGGLTSNYSGGTESQPKTLTSVSRDGSGDLTINFAAGQIVNYDVGTNIVLSGMTPSDLNGTFPVSAILFNQQSVTITGAVCTEPNTGAQPSNCVFSTTSTPIFGVGAFVQLVGTFSPSLNTGIDKYEVISVGTNTFSITASSVTRPNWPVGPTPITVTCTGTCSAATASALVASQAGAAESASVVGTASFVHPVHRMCDQGTSNSCNGDGFGTGPGTFGTVKCDRCVFRDNAQDGWDNLHSIMVLSTLTNSIASGNEGAPAKLGNADTVNMWNDELGANCSVLLAPDPNKPPDFNQYLALPCRANGFFGLFSREWSKMILTNITWGPGNQNVIWDDYCLDKTPGCSAPLPMASYISQNSAYIGFTDTNNPTWNSGLVSVYCPDDGAGNCVETNIPAWSWLNNAGFNVRNQPSGGSGNNWSLGTCPIIVCVPNISSFPAEVNALNYNVNITSGSALFHAGIVNAFTPATDINGVSRSTNTSIGALEPLGAPVLTTITVSPNPGSVVVGNTINFQTSSFCTFSDSSTIPAGSAGCVVVWSDTNAHSSINSSTGVATGSSVGSDTITATLAPASPGMATLNVTAATVATPTAAPPAGTYTSTQNVALSDGTSGASIVYTTNGSTPTVTALTCTITNGTLYTGPITVSTTQTIKAIGCKTGFNASGVFTGLYTITSVGPLFIQGVVVITGTGVQLQ